MSTTNLIRFGGLAAAIAGVLRGINSFLPSGVPSLETSLLYLLTEIFILFGMIGLYGFQHEESRLWGFWGFVLTTIGLLTIRTGEIAGVGLYSFGAAIFAIGLWAFAVGTWIADKLPRWASSCWLIAPILGFVGYFAPGLNLLFVLSGLLFGIGSAGAGIRVWSAPFQGGKSL
ncbi:MAG: hypothetical protein WA902_08740 [Thermosynechococcaceae cyanobacterium]